ncbi:Rhodanese-like domain-containing protein [Amylocarpus encephaloides]|uniref:Rhodanese-like domain-containing protein n=1 Tax=Amylocarpus encephaloides TaxID=45428 RepID=A0A9P7YEZ7_9HELO|nr:Rhodanese-like domain-containing protein [Amylocarpus encephaloides]
MANSIPQAPTESKKEPKEEWWSAFPSPRASVPEMTGDELMELFDGMDMKPEPRPFLLVDVRRTDWEGGTIRTSLNLAAQSFYQTRKTLLDLCDRANIKTVIFYCGASNGRGPRCAAWMQDYIDDLTKLVGHKSVLKVRVLKGGIKGWVNDFKGAMMDGFVEEHWEQFKQ